MLLVHVDSFTHRDCDVLDSRAKQATQRQDSLFPCQKDKEYFRYINIQLRNIDIIKNTSYKVEQHTHISVLDEIAKV